MKGFKERLNISDRLYNDRSLLFYQKITAIANTNGIPYICTELTFFLSESEIYLNRIVSARYRKP